MSSPSRSRPALILQSLALLASLALAACASAPPDADTEPAGGVIYLVRHAETDDSTPERPLDATGQARARTLADLLADADIDRILSSDFPRTRATAAPLAERLGLAVEIYDASDLPALAERLRNSQDTVLVVGHSNTTPELVVLLGGEDLGPIAESDHERVYRVDLSTRTTELSHY